MLLLFEKLFSIGSCRSGLRPCSGGLPLCFLPAPEGEDVPNRIRVLVKEKVYSPFEWTLVFQNLEEPGAGIWMKRERGDMQVPEAVTVDPAKILLLEE